ncbi:juvenile hormone acid O-methyltransferase-like [Musca autumnalis]|uniref:juvenile hormone acid O-methyltransferase-like n=1 Tax=Musca autumnalis TaxID=221902 RepID=UPI003CF81BC5
MYSPALYHKSHRAAKQDVGNIISEYARSWQWYFKDGDTLLDVGSGPGDVLHDYIFPWLPRNHGTVVCSDISPDMVEYAKELYGHNNKWKFQVLDISKRLEQIPKELRGQFDHVTSMLCLHWVQDHRNALNNIFHLLRPEGGGDCLLIFMSSHTIFDTYLYIKLNSKWSKYIPNVRQCISPLQGCENSQSEFAKQMIEAGFKDVKVELKQRTVNYGNAESFKENLKSICGILHYIPASKQSEFMDDFVEIMTKFMISENHQNEDECKYAMKYELLVAYGRKVAIKQNPRG